MSKPVNSKIGWIIVLCLAFLLVNGALFHFYRDSFSTLGYIVFLFIPLGLAVGVIFTRFSLLFIKNIEEEKEEGLLLQERQREIVENMVEGLVVHDSNGKILTMNATAESFLGVKRLDIKNKSLEDIKKISELFRVLFKDLKEGEVFEYSFNDKEGHEFDYQIIKITLNKERGEILKIIRDITRAKYLDRMKSEYVTIMSHKFLTPLTNIKWSADFLLGNDMDINRKKENVENILNNAEKLVKLTSYLLNITEIEEGLFGYNYEKVDVNVLIEEAIQSYADESKRKEVRITYNKSEKEDYFVRGDKSKLSAVIANYLDNAVKYTPTGGVVEISMEKNKGDLKVTIHDNGIGISPESIQSLFTKFFRDKRARGVHTEGSGIGLFIVKNVIERHGGKVGYLGDGENGSTFFFTLPLYKEEQIKNADLK